MAHSTSGPPPNAPAQSRFAHHQSSAEGDRTAAITISGIGASLLVAAAGTFIAISWDRLGLESKAGLVGMVALAALALGRLLAHRSPGTSAVLRHLGGFLIPIDVGGVATALGLERSVVGLIAGVVGFVVLTLLDQHRSPFMALGRVLSIGAAALGLAHLLQFPASTLLLGSALVVTATATAASRSGRLQLTRHFQDGLGLAIAAGLGPALSLAAPYSKPGSLVVWLADLTHASPAMTVTVGCAAAGLALLIDRRRPGPLAALLIAVIATPDAVSLIASHQTPALILLASAVVAARLWLLVANRPGWAPPVDLASLATCALAIFAATANVTHNAEAEVGAIATSVLLVTGWLLSDLESGRRVEAGASWFTHLQDGHTGVMSTIGLIASVGTAAIGTADSDWAAAIIVVGAALVGLTDRTGATLVARGGLLLGTLIAVGNPVLTFCFGLGAVVLLQARAEFDLAKGGAPRPASVTQLFGVATLVVAVGRLATSSNDFALGWALVASGAIVAVTTVTAFTSDRLAVPDLRFPPRITLLLAVVPLLEEAEIAGLVGLVIAALLFVDSAMSKLAGGDAIAAAALVVSSWLVAGGLEATFAEAYVIGPALAILWFGIKAMNNGASSWLGVAPAVSLIGFAALLERLGEQAGWHGAVVGTVGLISLTVGVERKWGGAAIVGVFLLVTAVAIEASAVVPQLPVWALLASGGTVLLGTGYALERRAGLGGGATLRATWAEFS